MCSGAQRQIVKNDKSLAKSYPYNCPWCLLSWRFLQGARQQKVLPTVKGSTHSTQAAHRYAANSGVSVCSTSRMHSSEDVATAASRSIYIHLSQKSQKCRKVQENYLYSQNYHNLLLARSLTHTCNFIHDICIHYASLCA